MYMAEVHVFVDACLLAQVYGEVSKSTNSDCLSMPQLCDLKAVTLDLFPPPAKQSYQHHLPDAGV